MPPLAEYRWLTSDDARAWLERASAEPTLSVRLAAALRRELSAERAHLVLEQAALRLRARAKFAAADKMFFTPRGLEQATGEVIARYKATKFPAGAPVADLCCGIGGDLMAFARRGSAVGVDRDPVAALVAAANAQVEVQNADAADFPMDEFAAWHIDPNRRPAGKRTTRVDLYEPGPEVIDRLRGRQPSVAVKLAPAAVLPDAWTAEAEQEWISHDGECKQLVAWFGSVAAGSAQRRATRLTNDGRSYTIVGEPNIPIPLASAVRRWLFEPDPAVLAAGLSGAVAGRHALHAICPQVAYLTGDSPVSDPLVDSFEISDVLPFDVGRLKRLVRDRRIGDLEIKKRGITCDPAHVRRQLQPKGDARATLIVTRQADRVIALVARRHIEPTPLDPPSDANLR